MVETMDWGRFYDRLDREPPHLFCMAYFFSCPDPDSALRASSVLRRSGWQNETYEGLVEEARRVTDQGVRMGMYQEADRILVEEAAIMPLAYERHHLLVKPWVRRWFLSATDIWFWKDLIIDPH
jgi:oligopeptide transport system substrate-binding protein